MPFDSMISTKSFYSGQYYAHGKENNVQFADDYNLSTFSPRITSVQYYGGCSVLRGMASVLRRLFSTVEDSISTAGVASVLRRDGINTVEG